MIIGGVAAAALVGDCTRDHNEADRGLRQDKAHTVSDADDKRGLRQDKAHTVSDADVKRLKAGTTLSAVEASLGQPAERDEDG